MSAVSIDKSGAIALVNIDHPPVNALSHDVRLGLFDAANQIDADDTIKAVVLICAGRTFIAGADIKEFGKTPKAPHLPDVINRIEASTKPWIAAIHGTALGGGFEVALGCHYRLGVSSAKVGLPEVHLGLIPGAGGTVRLPRLIDAKSAVEMVSSGKPIGAQKAFELGLFDKITDDNTLREDAVLFANSIINAPLPAALSSRQPVQNLSDTQWEALIGSIEKKAKGQLSPVEAAMAIKQACSLNAEEAFSLEREIFQKLRDSTQSKALRYVFFAERQTAKIDRVANIKAPAINNCGVLGGGTMGAGISASMLLSGKQVVLVERDNDALAAAIERVHNILNASQTRSLISASKFEALCKALKGSTDTHAFAQCDLVIEAVFEDMAVKKQVFANFDEVCKSSAILATNTSYLDINEIAASVKNPGRVVGLHFFSPAHIMKLVEVVAGEKISDATLASALAFAKSLRKVPVVSGVCEGFIANRIMSAYRKQCDYMLEDGCTPRQIDTAMKTFGLPMGMFEMADMAGLDIGWATRKRLAPTRDPKERYVGIADRLCELGRFGQKTGAGWYLYEEGSRAGNDDPLVQTIIEEEAKISGITRRVFSSDKIMERILAAMTHEAKAILDEGIAERASDIDIVMLLGYGFPRWRGGPIFMADMSG